MRFQAAEVKRQVGLVRRRQATLKYLLYAVADPRIKYD